MMMKHLLLTMLLYVAAAFHAHGEIVKARIIDEKSGAPLTEATVNMVVTFWPATRNISSLVPDSLGCVSAPVVGDNCHLEVSLIGYYPRKVPFVAVEGTDTLNLGDIALKPSDIYLQTAVVHVKAKRFVMRGDTVVFNPAAFQLSEGARLEELLQQLPGITQKEGKLFWMDKPVRILVNGENMFADNTILQQRLPAEAVDRIKAYNKASRLAERTGRDDGAEDHVLDIQVKPSFLERWYGSVEADGLTPDRFRALLDAMYFSVSDPFMAFANVNTTGQNTFKKTVTSSSMDDLPSFGRQQFGSIGYKHGWKRQGKEKELTDNLYTFCLEGQHQDSWKREGQSRETFLSDGPNTYNLNSKYTYDHQLYPRFNFQTNLELSERTRFSVFGNCTLKKQDTPETTRQATFEGDPYAASAHPLDDAFAISDTEALQRGLVARSRYESSRHTEEMTSEICAMFRHQFGKGGELWFSTDADYTDRKDDIYARRELRYFRSPEDNVLRYEADHDPSHKLDLRTSVMLKMWVAKPLLLTTDYGYNYERDYASRRHAIGGEAFTSTESLPEEAIDAANSFANRHTTGKHSVMTSLQFTAGKFKFTPQLTLNATHEDLYYQRGALLVDRMRDLWLWTPQLIMRWDLKRGQNLEVAYRYTTQAPDFLSTVNYTDDTDPLYIIEGNPLLRKSHSHSAVLSYFANITAKQQTVMAILRFAKQVDPIATLLSYHSQTGAYREQKMNVRGGYNVNVSLNLDRGLGEFVRLRCEVDAGHNRSYGYLLAGFDAAEVPLNRNLLYYTRFAPQASYEGRALNLSAGMQTTLCWLRYRPSAENNQYRQIYKGWISGKYRLAEWTFKTNLTLRGYAGYAMADMNRVIPDWMVTVGRRVLKGKGHVSLMFDDILNKRRNYGADQTATQRIESYSVSRHHYIELSFRYNFEAKGMGGK